MKKSFYAIVMGITTFSLLLCGTTVYADETYTQSANQASPGDVQAVTEEQLYNIGETAHGSIFDVTITSAEVVDRIENGMEFNMWIPAKAISYEDITAESGFSIIKISYQTNYKGKTNGTFPFYFELDYDTGYLFTPSDSTIHFFPKCELGYGYQKLYTFSTNNTFVIFDPLSYKGETATTYIAVNNIVLTNTESPLVLHINLPKSADPAFPVGAVNPYDSSLEPLELELVSFDFRTANLGVALYSERHEKTGKLKGQNFGLPSLNEMYGFNSWDIKYGDNPVLDTVFFQKDIDLYPYIGKEITFSYKYSNDNHRIDAYIIE